mmetsp:Transcript_15744/g.39604  ORF Transcript_15744/g.39604 Transcript_15744/m.39604 type:complete len:84 (-) Transcript_15744:768-1019(-)
MPCSSSTSVVTFALTFVPIKWVKVLKQACVRSWFVLNEDPAEVNRVKVFDPIDFEHDGIEGRLDLSSDKRHFSAIKATSVSRQ